jgi:hypothetical protein
MSVKCSNTSFYTAMFCLCKSGVRLYQCWFDNRSMSLVSTLNTGSKVPSLAWYDLTQYQLCASTCSQPGIETGGTVVTTALYRFCTGSIPVWESGAGMKNLQSRLVVGIFKSWYQTNTSLYFVQWYDIIHSRNIYNISICKQLFVDAHVIFPAHLCFCCALLYVV